MDYSVKKGKPEEQKTECFVVGAYSDKTLTPTGAILDKKLKGNISKLIGRGDITGKIGEAVMLQETNNLVAERILVIGCGKKGRATSEEFVKIADSAAGAIKKYRLKNALTALTEINTANKEEIQWKINQLVQSTERSIYKYDNFKKKKTTIKFTRLNLV